MLRILRLKVETHFAFANCSVRKVWFAATTNNFRNVHNKYNYDTVTFFSFFLLMCILHFAKQTGRITWQLVSRHCLDMHDFLSLCCASWRALTWGYPHCAQEKGKTMTPLHHQTCAVFWVAFPRAPQPAESLWNAVKCDIALHKLKKSLKTVGTLGPLFDCLSCSLSM